METHARGILRLEAIRLEAIRWLPNNQRDFGGVARRSAAPARGPIIPLAIRQRRVLVKQCPDGPERSGEARDGYFVVVVDSLSLYDEQVLSRLETLRIRLHDRSGVIVLAPYARPRAAAHFRLLFQYSSEDLYRWFYRLPVPSALRGQINLCEDDLDIGRLVTTVLPLPAGGSVRHPAITN